MIRERIRSSWLLKALALYGAAIGAAHADTACSFTPPAAEHKTVYVADYNGQPKTYDFWMRSDVCYGDGVQWTDTGISGKTVQLRQRAAIYTPTDPAAQGAPKRPVIIWTHPTGQDEKFAYDWNHPNAANNPYDTTSLLQSVLIPAMQAGYTVISLQFRHPTASFVQGDAPLPGNTDIRDGIQYIRFNAAMLNIDAGNMFLVGQSRGSLNMLWEMRGTQPAAGAAPGWRSQPWNVNAIWDYQAQTCYEKTTVASTFIDSATQSLFNSDNFDFPVGYAGCSFTDALSAPVLTPIRLMYDEVASGVKEPWCAIAMTQQQCWNMYHDDANLWNTYFDEHDANFGRQMKQSYTAAGMKARFSMCTGVAKTYNDKSGPYNGYAGYTSFFGQYSVPAVAGAVAPPCPVVPH